MDLASATDQNRGGIISRASNYVEQPMHAISEIDVPATRRPEHRKIAVGSALMRVRGLIQKSVIGLYLGNSQSDFSPTNPTNQKFS